MQKVCYTELIPEIKPFNEFVCSSENCTTFVLRSFKHLDLSDATSTNLQTHINATNFFLLNDFSLLNELNIRLSRRKKGGKTRELTDIVKLRLIRELNKLSIGLNNPKETQKLLKSLSATRVKINRCALTQPTPFTHSREANQIPANILIRLLGSPMVRPYLNIRVLNLINTTTMISRKYNMRFMRALLYNRHCEKYVFYGRDSYIPILPRKCLPASLEITHSDAIKHLANTDSATQLRQLRSLTIIRLQNSGPLLSLAQNLCSLKQLQLFDCAQSSLLASEILRMLDCFPKLEELHCNFKGCRFGIANITKILLVCFEKKLKSISIQDDPIDGIENHNSWMVDCSQGLPVSFDVSQNPLIEFEGIGINLANKTLFNLISTAPRLKKLSLINCYLPDDPFQPLWKLEDLEEFRFHGFLRLVEDIFRKPLVSLKSLELGMCEVNVDNINKIFQFEENYESLTRIKLTAGAFGPSTNEFWDQILGKLSKIEEITFESSMRCPLQELLQKIQEKRENLTHLKIIRFNGFELDLRALTSFELLQLPNLQQITLINLFFGSFEEYDLKKISASIKLAWGKIWRLESYECSHSFLELNLQRKKISLC